MSTLLTARNLTKSFAMNTLFTDVSIAFAEGDRLGMIGPNGAGKSTLMKILADLDESDGGEITRRRGLRVAYVGQDDVFPAGVTPRSVVTDAAEVSTGRGLASETRGMATLSRLGFADPDQPADTLSGGWRKRLSIAASLVNEPDVLLLDEPTNHLDLEGVIWLEQFVRQARMAIAFVTHDRMFLDVVADRIIELSPAYPGGTFEVRGNYSEFVRRKDAFLDAQAKQQDVLANQVRRDTAWLRQGIQGRQTRNKTQVADTDRRQAELKGLRDRNAAPTRTTSIDFQSSERRTRKLLAAHGIAKSMGEQCLFEGLELTLMPAMRIGLLGPNGSGKTTLLRVLGGELEPDAGTCKLGPDVNVVMFSQHRETLDPSETLETALCSVGDMVHYRGKPVHVSGWARRFLFDTNQLSTPVGLLSGGEQARVLIARLMLQPADVLLLDEPTNDLDIASLEVLEQAILEFPGAIVLVTHDRFMLRRLSTEMLALDGAGHAKTYASYVQWQRDHERRQADRRSDAKPAKPKADRVKSGSGGKLSYKLQRDFDKMEERILEAEAAVEDLHTRSADPAVIADHVQHTDVCRQLGEAQTHVQTLYDRWAELDAMRG